MRQLLKTLLGWVYPPRCNFCNMIIYNQAKFFLCSRCFGKLKFIVENACTNCGKSLIAGYDRLCGDCIRLEHHFDRAYSVVQYCDDVKYALIKYKFLGKKEIAGTFIELMWTKAQQIHDVEVVLSVPLHKDRLLERGFNQSQKIAQTLAQRLNVPLDDSLIRVKNTKSQALLSRTKRLKNLKSAFSVTDNQNILNKKLLLIDDIYTTGTTVSECAKTLKAAGAKEVYVLTVASGSGY